MMKKILVLLDNAFKNDRRVSRESETLVGAGFEVDLIAVKDSGLPENETINGVNVHRLLNTDMAFTLCQSAV